MGNANYKNNNIERKYLKVMQKNQFLKAKNGLLELEKDSIKLKDIELTKSNFLSLLLRQEVKTKREIGEK